MQQQCLDNRACWLHTERERHHHAPSTEPMCVLQSCTFSLPSTLLPAQTRSKCPKMPPPAVSFFSPCASLPRRSRRESYGGHPPMEHHRPHHHSEWSHRSTTTTAIAGLSWPPRRSASFLKAGYSGLESSLCLDFDPGWSTHQVRPLTLATIQHRLSAATPPVPPSPRQHRKETGSTRSGERQASSRPGSKVKVRRLTSAAVQD